MRRLTLSSIILASALVLPTAALAQATALTGAAKWADSAAREIDRAYVTGDVARLQAARTLLDRGLVAFPKDPLLLHYQGYELYREANLLTGLRRTAEVPPLLEKARAALEQSITLKPLPESHALLSSVLGQMIGADPSLGMTLGPQSGQEMTDALSYGATNPRVWMLAGISSMFTPAEYGGSLSNAEIQLNKAIELFASDHPVSPAPSWGQAEAYAWLGQVLQKENKSADAATAYNKALALQPDFTWVKMVLLPSVKK
jgi:tetratricopeptide (TPR) repeat protein